MLGIIAAEWWSGYCVLLTKIKKKKCKSFFCNVFCFSPQKSVISGKKTREIVIKIESTTEKSERNQIGRTPVFISALLRLSLVTLSSDNAFKRFFV